MSKRPAQVSRDSSKRPRYELTTQRVFAREIMPATTVTVKKVVRRGKKAKRENPRFMKADTGAERKTTVVTINAAISSTGAVANLVSLAKGTSDGQRLAQQILMRSIYVDVGVQVPTASLANVASFPDNSDGVRACLVYDKQPNGATAAWSDVYTSSGSANTPYFSRNVGTRDRFVVLKEWRSMLNASEKNADRFVDFVKCNLPVRYNGGNAGNVTDIVTGNLMFMMADEVTGGALFANMYGIVQVNYTDD